MTDLMSAWWFWLSAAMVLGIIEVLVPAFIFLGFAIGAGAMGLLLATGLVSVTPAWSIALFAGLSLAGYAVLRVALGRTRGDVRIVTKDVNDN